MPDAVVDCAKACAAEDRVALNGPVLDWQELVWVQISLCHDKYWKWDPVLDLSVSAALIYILGLRRIMTSCSRED